MGPWLYCFSVVFAMMPPWQQRPFGFCFQAGGGFCGLFLRNQHTKHEGGKPPCLSQAGSDLWLSLVLNLSIPDPSRWLIPPNIPVKQWCPGLAISQKRTEWLTWGHIVQSRADYTCDPPAPFPPDKMLFSIPAFDLHISGAHSPYSLFLSSWATLISLTVNRLRKLFLRF